jgi:hypothetical protein
VDHRQIGSEYHDTEYHRQKDRHQHRELDGGGTASASKKSGHPVTPLRSASIQGLRKIRMYYFFRDLELTRGSYRSSTSYEDINSLDGYPLVFQAVPLFPDGTGLETINFYV